MMTSIQFGKMTLIFLNPQKEAGASIWKIKINIDSNSVEHFCCNKFYENIRKSLHIGRKVMRLARITTNYFMRDLTVYVIVYVHFSWWFWCHPISQFFCWKIWWYLNVCCRYHDSHLVFTLLIQWMTKFLACWDVVQRVSNHWWWNIFHWMPNTKVDSNQTVNGMIGVWCLVKVFCNCRTLNHLHVFYVPHILSANCKHTVACQKPRRK